MKFKAVSICLWLFLLGMWSDRCRATDRPVIGHAAITGIKAGLWVAADAGIFDKPNIQVELLLVASASQMVQAMLGGDLPFAAAGGNAVKEMDNGELIIAEAALRSAMT